MNFGTKAKDYLPTGAFSEAEAGLHNQQKRNVKMHNSIGRANET
jgi:hypothetical protein